MTEQALPDGRALRSRLTKIDSIVSLPALGVIGLYVYTLLELSPGEWATFGAAGAIFGVLSGIAFEPVRRRIQAPLRSYLDLVAAGEEPSQAQLHAAFASAIALPRIMMTAIVACWVSAAPLIPVIAWMIGDPRWLEVTRFGVLAVAAGTGAVFSAGFLYFSAKRELTGIRESLASRIPDPEARRDLIRRVPLARKLRFAVVGSSVASLVFAMGLTYSRAADSVEEVVIRFQQRAIAAMAERVERDGLDRGRASVLPDPSVAPHTVVFDRIPAEAVGDEGVRWPLVWEQVEAGDESGVVNHTASELVASWIRLADDSVLIASTPRAELRDSLGGMETLMALVVVLAILLALGVAQLLAADVRRAVEALSAEAERMAQGDLRRGRVFESEDELGDLSRSFERMGGALRGTVGRVAEAADRLDSAAGEIATLGEGVGAASADQVRRIQQAAELMAEIKGQVRDVSQSAQALNVSVEESSSSILELGAAGDELNETASVLGERVEEVSGSIDQMVHSVKQVGTHSAGLADIAAETSSSMEEMASAMLAVDNTAEKTAELYRSVVESAENGQAKVSQTIEGMEAIRDATDSAEHVVHGLSERAKEIGAILDVIDDVADETNLLALNAAIIAAQAGEHGRAFSVVADEIKELADRVLSSTKEIGGLITSVQEESANATGAIAAGSRSVAQGVELSAEAGVSLETITRSARESGTRIQEIVYAVREQTKAAGHVVELMENVRGGVEQIRVAGSEQDRGNEVVHRSSITMRDVAQQVRRTTEEQSRGFGRIRESVEGVRLAVEQINGSLQEQSDACNQVATFLDQVFERTRSNEEAGQQMGEAMRGLLAEAESLREDVAKFQI